MFELEEFWYIECACNQKMSDDTRVRLIQSLYNKELSFIYNMKLPDMTPTQIK